MHSLFQPNNPKRQKLISSSPKNLLLARGKGGGIKTIESLKKHLQVAIELEHSTIPPYLCALYSIKEGTNIEASKIIRSVVVEEMLHMVMAANLLNAIGGKPSIDSKKFIPSYPTYLPFSDESFLVSLEKFSKDSIEVFLKIEKPAPNCAPPEANKYHSIGQFYAAIMDGIERLNAETKGGIFIGDTSKQVTGEHYYGSGGKLVPVYSIADAKLAIDEIVGQGEGIDGTIEDPDHVLFGEEIEYAHYFKYMEIYHERMYQKNDSPQKPPTGIPMPVDWNQVHNMKKNSKMLDYTKGSEIWQKNYDFNKLYMQLLTNIHHACNGQPELLMKGVALMYDLKYKAIELMNIPIGNGETAGPTFEYVK